MSNRKNFCKSNLTSNKCWYPQNKKGLALPWTCGKSWEYRVGKSVAIETDQKPLKLFLSDHTFDQLPQRIQRFRMQQISFHFRHCACPWKEDVRCLKPSSPAYHWWWQNWSHQEPDLSSLTTWLSLKSSADQRSTDQRQSNLQIEQSVLLWGITRQTLV